MFGAIFSTEASPPGAAAVWKGVMAITGNGSAAQTFLARIARTRMATRAALTFERAWPRLLPVLVIAALYISAAWLGYFRLVPDWLRIATGVLFALAALFALVPLRGLRLPGHREIDDRIERANALPHRPVTTQSDRLARSGDPFSDALWHEHQKRLAEGVGRLGAASPHTGIPRRDPLALRAIAGLLLVAAFAFSFGPGGGTIGDVFVRQHTATMVPPRIDAWVTPPAYSGRAPVFMTAEANRDTDRFNVPWGSAVTVRVTGGGGNETLEFATEARQAAQTIEPKDDAGRAAARQFTMQLEHDGTLALATGGNILREWAFTVIPDKAPTIRFVGEPKRAANGALELAYAIEDDYGAKSAEAMISLGREPGPGARPLYDAPELPLALPRRNAAHGSAKTSSNLTEHPWAGGPVRIRLKAVDAAGQEAFSDTRDIIMPERSFTNPLARAVIEQRRILALDANRVPRVLLLLDSAMLRPAETLDNPAHFLGLTTIRSRLKLANDDDGLRGVVDYMWEVALQIEDGDLTAAERRLRDAQQALRDALENGASDEEIERLMSELRDAMNEFLREFAERSLQNPNMPQMPQQGQELRRSDLDRLLDQIENLAKSGARDRAQDLLSQLENMMNNLQAGRQQQGQSQNAMREQLNELGEIMRRQQEMMNETFRLDQMQRGQRGSRPQQGQREQQGQDGEQGRRQPGQQGQQGENQPGQGDNGMTADELAEALRQLREGQGRLQDRLGELMDQLRGLGLEPGEGFGEAGEAMDRAGEALGRADGEEAVGNQGQALEALRRGAQDMMNQMQQARQGEQGGSEEGGTRQGSADRDPLGRPRATTGPDFGDSVDVPDEIDTQRAREILEAIRRRLGNALSPEVEKRYLERLLELQ